MTESPVPGRGAPVARATLELGAVVAAFGALTAWFTHPLAFTLRTHGYKLETAGDAQYSVWNIAWVAHALIEYPRRVFHANIFYPHEGALFFSEPNLLSGALAVPAYWLSGSPYAAHNLVVLLSFVFSATATYYLVRHLVNSRRAAVFAAVCFAYCPYIFSHLPHIQLLMTWGIPLSLLAFHRMAERPSIGRGVVLGISMAAAALACAYYGAFVVVLVGISVLVTAGWDRLWRSRAYWMAVATAAVVSASVVGPLFLPFRLLQRETGFRQGLQEAATYSANWASYLASGAYAWSWLLPMLPDWGEILALGIVLTCCAAAGVIVGWRYPDRTRRLVVLYLVLGGVAFWQSLGPRAGLFTVTSFAVPGFVFLRAPSRFGVFVTLAAAVLAAVAIARLPSRRWATAAFVLLLIGAIAERVVPLPLRPIPRMPPVYDVLARRPYGPVIELPVYSHSVSFERTKYMLGSTVHWKPLVNAYSDFIPPAFAARREVLAEFPSSESFEILRQYGVRYAVFHIREYGESSGLRARLTSKLRQFAPFMTEIYADSETWLYEITGYP